MQMIVMAKHGLHGVEVSIVIQTKGEGRSFLRTTVLLLSASHIFFNNRKGF